MQRTRLRRSAYSASRALHQDTVTRPVPTSRRAAPIRPIALRYLHISDLHLAGQPKDKAGWETEQFNQDFVTRSMLDAIETLVQREGKALDLIFITGDLAKQGKPEDYLVAEVFCRRLLEVTGVTAERLFLVPGNHDVDRRQFEETAPQAVVSL